MHQPPRPPAANGYVSVMMGVLGMLAITLLAYLPTVNAGFIWNDSDYVTAPELRSWHGLWRIWTDVGATEQYYPLLHGAFWLEHRLWGDWTSGYHLANITLHGIAAFLFAAILRRLAVPGAWLAGALFALHPVCVESVAWVSEQKNTLSLVFYLGAALAYLQFELARETDPSRGRNHYHLALVLFICALFTKTTTAVLPAVLLVITWWRKGRIEWSRDCRPLLSWFVLGAVLGLFSAWVEKHFIGAAGTDFELDFLQRGLLAGRIICFYFGKLLLPASLIFIYPRWTVDASVAWQWIFPIVVVGALGIFWRWRNWTRTPLAVLLLFAGALFPVMGFFNVYAFVFSFVADHWQYLPCLPILALVAAVLVRAHKAVGVLVAGALGVMTWQQGRMYDDMETFYRATLVKNQDCWMAHNNLGSLLRQAGRIDEALAEYEITLKLKPDSAKAHTNVGNILRERRQLALALPHFEAAVRLEPDDTVHQDNLAGALRDAGRPREALMHHREALRLAATFHVAHNNYGLTLRALGRQEEAIAQFEAALRFEPNSAPAHLNLAYSYWLTGRVDRAQTHYQEARRLNPAVPELDLSIPPR